MIFRNTAFKLLLGFYQSRIVNILGWWVITSIISNFAKQISSGQIFWTCLQL